jgi:hypothetical protein
MSDTEEWESYPSFDYYKTDMIEAINSQSSPFPTMTVVRRLKRHRLYLGVYSSNGIRWLHKESKFRPRDNVRFRDAQTNEQEGRCIVTSVPATGKYTLENQNGKTVNGGASIKEEELVKD